MGQKTDGRAVTNFQDHQTPGSEREYHQISRSQMHSHFMPSATSRQDSKLETNKLSGSNNYVSKSTSKKLSESSFLKTVFAENSEIISKHTSSSKKNQILDESPTFTESPFLDRSADNSNKKESNSVERKYFNSYTSTSSRSEVEEENLAKGKGKSYEVTEEDKKRYLAFLEKPGELKEKNKSAKTEKEKQALNEGYSSRYDNRSTIARDESVKYSDVEKVTLNDSDRMEPSSILFTASNVFEHSPGEVYTIPEDEDEIGSPTAPDGVSRLRRKSKALYLNLTIYANLLLHKNIS